VICIKILILTGTQSYSILKGVIQNIQTHQIEIVKVPVSISAFITPQMVKDSINTRNLSGYDLILLPGFVQWDSFELEEKFKIPIRKGPEFASDLPMILKNLEVIDLSTNIPANQLFESSGTEQHNILFKEMLEKAMYNISTQTFFINQDKSDVMIGKELPPPIIAEIVNCPKKSNESILKKTTHYIESGADIIDIGCIANAPNQDRVREIIKLIHNHFNILISIDSMDSDEILAAVDEGIDMILSFDIGNYETFLDIPRDIPIVILPTNINKGYFPRDPQTRVQNLFDLTDKLQSHGFTKLIADPLLETPISPGIINSLQAYYLYTQISSKKKYKELKLPMFFGISNVVELMDVDSVGINGLLASIAAELDMGILFTVEHSTKMFGGVKELKKSMMLNYLAKHKNTPPINIGMQVFKAKGKTSQEIPDLPIENIVDVKGPNTHYRADEAGYFKIYVDHYKKRIFVLFYSNKNQFLNGFSGQKAEFLSKKIIELKLTTNLTHINYLGRELKKAEMCLKFAKPYIQDE
jgi:dihydropteroate synthase-like protein